jgi:hypothetical protein
MLVLNVPSRKTGAKIPADEIAHHIVYFFGCKEVMVTACRFSQLHTHVSFSGTYVGE